MGFPSAPPPPMEPPPQCGLLLSPLFAPSFWVTPRLHPSYGPSLSPSSFWGTLCHPHVSPPPSPHIRFPFIVCG